MVKRLAYLVAVLFLTGCATFGAVGDSVTLTVRTYEQATGKYVLELRNDSTRPVLYLNPYRIFSTVRSDQSEPFPLEATAVEGTVLLIHDTLLDPGESVVFTGICTRQGACARPATYVSVRVCWSNRHFTCDRYWPIWSDTPINGT